MLSYQSLTEYNLEEHHIEVAERHLKNLLSILLRFVPVDEAWYRSENMDVEAAIVEGKFVSSQDHYCKAGYFEGRLPRPIAVDETWYLKTYPDVADAVRKGVFSSGQHHFGTQGFREGRLPNPEWSLLVGGPLSSKSFANLGNSVNVVRERHSREGR